MHRVIKYLIAGACAAGVNLAALYVLTDLFGLWYLLSAALAFILGFFVSFTLQKFWTFNNPATHALVPQATIYFVIVFINFGLNTLGMYLMVDILHIWYLLSEFIVLGLIAFESFFAYRTFVFHTKNPSQK